VGARQADHAATPGGRATFPSLPIFGDGPHRRSAPDEDPRARGWPSPWASACRSQSTRRTYQIDGRLRPSGHQTPRSLRLPLRASEQTATECVPRVRRAGWEMIDLTGSQRLHIAKLRRLLPIPWHRQPASVPWRSRHRSASGPIRPCPPRQLRPSASRCTVRSRCAVRSRGGISGIGFAAFTFPLTHE